MGTSKRRFYRSDEEANEGSGDAPEDAAGPSSAPRKRRKLSDRQAPSQSHQATGTSQRLKWLKGVARKEKDSDSDWEESSSDREEIPAKGRRHRWSHRPEEKKIERENCKRSRKDSTKHLSSNEKRARKPSSAQKASHSAAKFGYHEETVNQSTQGWTLDEAQIFLGEQFEEVLFDEALSASRVTYTKELDLPERFQIHEESLTAAASQDDWTKEACWIYDRLFPNSEEVGQDEDLNLIAEMDKELIVQEIIYVLMQLHLEKCEVPVIGMYKFQECLYLTKRSRTKDLGFDNCADRLQIKAFKVLWMVFEWDRKWLSLSHRKNSQQESWKKRAMNKQIGSDSEGRTLDVLLQALQDADSEVAVDDLDAKFNLEFSTDGDEASKGQYKRPKRQSFYSACCKAGLRQLMKQLGLSPEQLGENLDASEKIHEPINPSAHPENIDLSYATGQFLEPRTALAGARHMAAHALTCEPRLRKFVRRLFVEHAVVSTRPTSKGKASIDALNEFTPVKYIQAKSVKSINDGAWLLIQKAEEDELLEVQIELTEDILNGQLTQSLETMYFSNASDEIAELWNEQRKLTLQEALSKMLLPLLIKEMRTSLMVRAKDWVQAQCCKSLWKRVSMAPYPINEPFTEVSTSSKGNNDAENAMVLACCWGSRNPPTTFVMLDAFGEMVDTLQTGYLAVRSASQEQHLPRQSEDEERLKNFILQYNPNVVVVGAVPNPRCRYLKDAIVETIGKAAELNSALTSVPVIYGDESLASLYEKSQVSLMQLPRQPGIIRRAVALGRTLQNPLALIAALCNPSKDIVALSMHPLQRFLSTEVLYTAIEHVMVTITNQVGVDVNLAVAHEWLFAPLQFVCGLGWNKATRIEQLVKESGWLPSREALCRYPFSLKDVIFKNCSGLFRIRRVGQALSGLRKLNPLDDTRIHPDHYEVAQNLAMYSFTDGKIPWKTDRDMDTVEQSILNIRKNSDALTEETVMAFFNSLQIEGEVSIEILQDIRLELLCGFEDCRVPYSRPTQDEEFTWLTGEDDTTLCIGKAVNALVQRVFRHRVICTLESGVRGVLEKEDFSSDTNIDLSRVFSEGGILTCYVANVLKDQLSVQLTTLGNITEANSNDTNDLPLEGLSQNLGDIKSNDNYFKPRMIQHLLFQNISIFDAIKALSNENPGKVIFHPSNEGAACLSMTLKVQDNVYVQKEIEELGKDGRDLAGYSQLGNILKIDGKNFSTLDEVVTSYASPLALRMNEVLQSRLFQTGNDMEIKSFLEREKQNSGDSLVYCFSLCPSNTAGIAISYMVDESILREEIHVYPEGYGLNNKMFRKMDTVVNYIQKMINDSRSRWAGQNEEQFKQKGDGAGRGRGGRFGAGRGRGGRFGAGRAGPQGRGGRRGSFSCNWAGGELEKGDQSSLGCDPKNHKEEGFSNWAVKESVIKQEQNANVVERLKSEDKDGWGITSSENCESKWGADDSNNMGTMGWGDDVSDLKDSQNHNENQNTSGLYGKESTAAEGTSWSENTVKIGFSESKKDSGWGGADAVQVNATSHTKCGWDADDSENMEKCGWGAADSKCGGQDQIQNSGGTKQECGGWGTADSSINEKEIKSEKQDVDVWHIAEEDCRNTGWGSASQQVDNDEHRHEWGGQSNRDNREIDRTGWVQSERLGSGQRGQGFQRRGRSFQGRAGRGNREQGRWGSRGSGNNHWNSGAAHLNEHVAEEKGGPGQNRSETGWGASSSQQNRGLKEFNSESETKETRLGWGTDDSGDRRKSGWATGGRWERQDEEEGKHGCNVQSDKDNSRLGWGGDSFNETEKSGWGAEGCRGGRPDEESQKCGGDGIGRGYGGRFRFGQRGRGYQRRGGRRDWLPEKRGAQQAESRDWNSYTHTNEHKEDTQGFNNVTENGSNSWGEKASCKVSRTEDEFRMDNDSRENFKGGWEQDFSEKPKDIGWGAEGPVMSKGPRKTESNWNAWNQKEDVKGENGWGVMDVQFRKDQQSGSGWGVISEIESNGRGGDGEGKNGLGDGKMSSNKCQQSGSGWGVDDSENMENNGWKAANHRWTAPDKENCKQTVHVQGKVQRENSFSGKGEAQEMETGFWNSAHSSVKEHVQDEAQSFSTWAAEESKDQKKSSPEMFSENLEAKMIENKSKWNSASSCVEEHREHEGQHLSQCSAEESSVQKKPSGEVSKNNDKTSWHGLEEKGLIKKDVAGENAMKVKDFEGQNDWSWNNGSKAAENEGWGAEGHIQVCQDEDAEKQLASSMGKSGPQKSLLGDGCSQEGDTLSRKCGAEDNQEGSSATCVLTERTMLQKGSADILTAKKPNMNEQETIVLVTKCKDSENVEARSDCFWGACEDLVDSNELDVLLNQRNSTNNALQSE